MNQHLFEAHDAPAIQFLRKQMAVMMMMMMRARRLLVDPKTRSDLLRTCSIAILSFWCLDAKGGKVVLLGLSVVLAWAG
jgi:hypothetical protein